MADVDWKKIRKEYIAGGTSLRKLAAKYGISRARIERRSRDEQWADAKSQRESKAMAKMIDSLAAAEADTSTGIILAAGELIVALRESLAALRAEGPVYPRSLKEYSEALRNTQQVLDSKPTTLDIEEQRARIDKMRKDIEGDHSKEPVVVKLEGVLDDYA